MSKTFDAAGIATLALRKVQAISPYETAADEQRTSVALQFLDLIISELAGTEELTWLLPGSQEISLVSGQSTYALSTLLSSGNPLQFVHRVFIRSSTGHDTPIKMVTKEHYDGLDLKAETGEPEMVYIDHNQPVQRAIFYPVPTTAQDGLKIFVDGQRFALDMTQDRGSVSHELPDAWQGYLVNRLALDIGDGPIKRATATDRDRWKALSDQQMDKLMKYQNRRHRQRPRVSKPYMG